MNILILQMFKYVLLAVIFHVVYCEDALKSQCPDLFQYGKTSNGTYEATLILKSDAKLHGVWIRVFFEPPVYNIKVPVSKKKILFKREIMLFLDLSCSYSRLFPSLSVYAINNIAIRLCFNN